MLSLIYARSLNHCIGNRGRIPWHLPDEFSHFSSTTMGKPIIMGRKSYEDHNCALPGRLNIVISRQSNYELADGVVLANSLSEATNIAQAENDEVFIIGGVSFLVEAFSSAERVYETVVEAHIEGDTVLPAFDFSEWHTQQLTKHESDERHEHAFTVYLHSRSTTAL